MDKLLYEVTRDRFDVHDPTIYILEGLCPRNAVLSATLGGVSLKIRTGKPEFVSAVERFRDLDARDGERVIAAITLPAEFSTHDSLRVTWNDGKKDHLWFAAKGAELRTRQGRPQYYIEEEAVTPQTLQMRGWAIAASPVDIVLCDEDWKPVQVQIRRNRRADVEQIFREADNPGQEGFFFELPRPAGKKLYLVFSAGQRRCVYTIELRRHRILMNKADRLSRKGMHYLRQHGLPAMAVRTAQKVLKRDDRPIPYEKWLPGHLAAERELERQRGRHFENAPLFSVVVPLYKTPEVYLLQLTESVKAQTYDRWELILSDGSGADSPLAQLLEKLQDEDERIHVICSDRPLSISANTNAAVGAAGGDYLVFADHDDILTPDALYEFALALEKAPRTRLLYTDEDKMTADGHKFFQPHFKPDFNEHLLRTVNYICHLLAVHRNTALKTGLFQEAFDGAQDYDFVLRVTEALDPDQIYHVPRILYHWRAHEDSTAENPESKRYAFEAGRRALQAHYRRLGIPARVENGEYPGLYRTWYLRDTDPLISVLIPSKDHIDDLRRCLDSLLHVNTYTNLEILILENNSESEETFRFYEDVVREDARIRILTWKDGFNFSAINNFGAAGAKGDILLLLNNDTQIISPDTLELMLGHCLQDKVGAVGARLYYEDDTVQHAGVVIGFGGIAGHCFVQQPRGTTGYMHRIICTQEYSAVTAACMMVRKEVYMEAGGLDEALTVAFNDIDFCLRLREQGYQIVYEPYAELYHYESKSRGLDDTPEKAARFAREIAYFEKRWKDILRDGDPYYNPNLTLESQDFSLRRR